MQGLAIPQPPLLPGPFDASVHLPLMAARSIAAREDDVTLIARGTHCGVSGALCPCFVLTPDVTAFLLLISSAGPTAVLLGTAPVNDAMFPETKGLATWGSLGGRGR
jgi:hypothetical protein